MLRFKRFLAFTVSALAMVNSFEPSAADAEKPLPDEVRVKLETLKRLKGIDPETNPAVKGAIDRVLDQTQGTKYFIEIIRDFNMRGREADLIQFAIQNPDQAASVGALRHALEQDGGRELIRERLAKELPTDPAEASESISTNTLNLVKVLGKTEGKEALDLLLAPVKDRASPQPLRVAAVQALSQTKDGANAILELAGADALPPELRLTAATALNASLWNDIRNKAAELLPMPQTRDAEPLPPVSELLQRKGNAEAGAKVFARPESACLLCHQVGDQGVDFGPALSEIGTKLGKEALYQSILEPNAGVSFGYEGWDIATKDGAEFSGIIVSETEEDVALKNQISVINRIPKEKIATRRQSSFSLMPSGLQQSMTARELVDLVEYLASLKKASD